MAKKTISLVAPGTLGNDTSSQSDGIHIGTIVATNPTKALLKSLAAPANEVFCFTDDGGLYVDESTPLNNATADDVEVLASTPANDDAVYFGLSSGTFHRVDLNLTTQGVGTWTINWEYWTGTAWAALSGVTDGTTGLSATTGIKSLTFTVPTNWAANTVDSVLAYWIRGRVSAYAAVTTPPEVGQGWIVGSSASWVDDTTDFTDADAGDVKLLPDYPLVGDGFYVGYSEKFCKIKLTHSQARTGTATISLKYWNGSTWAAVTVVDDDTSGYSATVGTLFIHFVPPTDWVANTVANGPNGQVGFFVVMELTALTDVTQQPLATRGWVLPLKTNASGLTCGFRGYVKNVQANARTASGSTADSYFLLVNATKGTSATLQWSKADAFDEFLTNLFVEEDDQLVLVQVTEDGSTEFANAIMNVVIVG